LRQLAIGKLRKRPILLQFIRLGEQLAYYCPESAVVVSQALELGFRIVSQKLTT
jgi:hypothetical protein